MGAIGSWRWTISKASRCKRARTLGYNHQERETRAVDPPLGSGTDLPNATNGSSFSF